MDVKVENEWTVGHLIDLQREQILRVNHEYQRGLRWILMQKCMFIDSIFRGYPIPAFYFHLKETSAGSIINTHYDIVDGQQRIDAIYSYSEGAFPLLDPSDEASFRFPNFAKPTTCPWGGKCFSELPKELQDQLKNHKIVVYKITTKNENSIRDLFIRLQGGTPLTSQDKRDSWPGNFTEFILKIGGKKEVLKYPGLPLFQEIAKGNESRRRQLVAQIFMLFWTTKMEMTFCDIKSSNIDVFYHSQVGFDRNSDEARNFEKICKKLYESLKGKPKIPGHYIIHLVLLVDSLLDEYVSGWEPHLAIKLNEFEERRRVAAEANKNRRESEYERYYSEYGQWTQTRSDDRITIRRRHAFFVQEMLNLLLPRKRDSNRAFTELQRRTVFFRDMELCQCCRMKEYDNESSRVSWDECEIHHVVPHVDGGDTSIHNAVLVHRDCHPKSKTDVERFSEWWRERSRRPLPDPNRPSRPFPPPEGTKVKFEYRGQLHMGNIRDRKLVLSGSHEGICKSFSDASKEVTKTSRNGWLDWYLCLPDEEAWVLADEWRKKIND